MRYKLTRRWLWRWQATTVRGHGLFAGHGWTPLGALRALRAELRYYRFDRNRTPVTVES